MGQEKKIRRGHVPCSTSEFGVYMTTTLLITFCCCEWFCRRETTSRQRTSFCLKVKQKLAVSTETSQQPTVLPWCTVDPIVQSLSHFGALAVLGSFQVSQMGSNNCFPCFPLTSKELQTKAWSQNKERVTRGHVCLVLVEHLGQSQNFSKAWLGTLNDLDHQDSFLWEPRKPNLSTTAPSAPKDQEILWIGILCILPAETSYTWWYKSIFGSDWSS